MRPGAKMSLEGLKSQILNYGFAELLTKMQLMLQETAYVSLFLHHRQVWLCSKKRRVVHMLERHHIEGRPAGINY